MHSGVRENIKIHTVLLLWYSGGSISFKLHGIYGAVANNFMSECGAHKGCLLSESMLDQCFLFLLQNFHLPSMEIRYR